MRAEAECQIKMTVESNNHYPHPSAEQQPSGGEQSKDAIKSILATAMRAANVADFYMTKYLSKAQEALGPVMQPFIEGMRRIAEAESAPEAANTSLVQRARQLRGTYVARKLVADAHKRHQNDTKMIQKVSQMGAEWLQSDRRRCYENDMKLTRTCYEIASR